ncbi:MAG: hypothetical protein DMG12_24675, partial [Acidobacteria bacterium]
SVDDIQEILRCGADKVSLNTSAVEDPYIVQKSAERFGSQCIVVAIDARRENGGAKVYTHGGRVRTNRDAVEWAGIVAEFGAGEILLTSMDADGTKNGYDLELTRKVADSVQIPVIASGGAGTLEHLRRSRICRNAELWFDERYPRKGKVQCGGSDSGRRAGCPYPRDTDARLYE